MEWREYRGPEIEFRYPGDWEFSTEPHEGDLTLSVQKNGAFWMASILRGRPRVEQVLNQVVEAFREEYDELDDYGTREQLCGEEVDGRVVEFFSFELVNHVSLRARRTGRFTLLVMSQTTDHESDQTVPVFEGITQSLRYASDDDIEIK